MEIEKKKKKSEITRSYIYEGSLKLFSSKGFNNTTIRDLTSELGISLGILYYHFKSKEDILIHYFRSLQERTNEGTSEILASNKAVSTKILHIIEVNMSLLKEDEGITKDLINSTSNLSHPLSPFGSELKDCQQGAIELFKQALSAEHKPGEYLDSIAFLYWFYYLGICLCWANDNSENNQNTEKLLKITFPLTRKMVTLTRIGVGKSLLIKISNLLKSILIKWDE